MQLFSHRSSFFLIIATAVFLSGCKEAIKAFDKSSATGIAYPENEQELKECLEKGAAVISLEKITSIKNESIFIPAHVVWYPPEPGKPISLGNQSFRLEINGPPAVVPEYQIFTDWQTKNRSKPSVTGYFAGIAIRTAWWMGTSAERCEDAAPAIEAAARSLRPPKMVKECVKQHKGYGGIYTGGKILIPAGIWPVKSEINLSNTYTKIYGSGRITILCIDITASEYTSAFNYKSNSFNSGVHDLQIKVLPTCHDRLSVFYVGNGAMEGSTFSNLVGSGCEKAIWRFEGASINHFEISNCHFVKPNLPTSVGILAHSAENNFDLNNTTFAGIGSSWARGIDLQGGGNIRISRCHFEFMNNAAIYISNERSPKANYAPNVLVNNCSYNFKNSFKDKNRHKTEGSPLLWIRKHNGRNSAARVTLRAVSQRNSDVMIRDDAFAGKMPERAGLQLDDEGELTQKRSRELREFSRTVSGYYLFN